MIKKILFVLVIITCTTTLVFGQTKNDQPASFFEIGFMYLTQLGDVYEKGSNRYFYGTLYPDSPQDQAVQQNHSGNHLGLAFVYSHNFSRALQVGVGLNTEMYLNIGNTSLFALPLYGHIKYNLTVGKNNIFSYGDAGYSPFTGGSIHSGLKAGLGLGYEIVSNKSGHRYSLGAGYNYQALMGIEQNVFSTTFNQGGQTNTLIKVNKVNLGINTLPITFKYTF